MDYRSVVSSIEKPASTSPLLGPHHIIIRRVVLWRELTIPAADYFFGKIVKMLLDEANDSSCATTNDMAFKVLYLPEFF
jgi:hypothetical protein